MFSGLLNVIYRRNKVNFFYVNVELVRYLFVFKYRFILKARFGLDCIGVCIEDLIV